MRRDDTCPKSVQAATVLTLVMTNILSSLGAGSGIDVKALTEQLIEIEATPRQKLLDTRLESVEARISALGQFQQALTAMVQALDGRIQSGALSGRPSVSDGSILGFTVAPGTIVDRQTVEVRQLARSQTLASAVVANEQAAIGEGSLTIRFGQVSGEAEAGPFTPSALAELNVTIGPENSSLAGIRDAINRAAAAAGAPIQALLIADTGGTRLMLRGATGEQSGFTVDTAGDSSLEIFRFNEAATGGMDRSQTATDSIVSLDGLILRRSSNSIDDLVPGARITLSRAAPGTLVAIEAKRSAADLAQTVGDVAGALNELAEIGRELSKSAPGSVGVLVSDSATRNALQKLTSLTSVQLIPTAGNAPTRLADIGLSIDRYGKFTIDSDRLTKAAQQHPGAVEALLTAMNRQAGSGQAAGPLRQISDVFTLATKSTASQPSALQAEKQNIAREQEALDARVERLRTTYTKQFTALDVAVGKSKALQTYMEQQIALWTKRKD